MLTFSRPSSTQSKSRCWLSAAQRLILPVSIFAELGWEKVKYIQYILQDLFVLS